MKKVIIIIVAIVSIVLAGIFAVGIYYAYTFGDAALVAKEEADEFAMQADKEQCLGEYIDRSLACTELECFSASAAFGLFCLEAASGTTEEFCSDKPKSQAEFYEGDWKSGICAEKGLDTSGCLGVYKIVEAHCSN